MDTAVTAIGEARGEAWLGNADGQVYRVFRGDFDPVGESALTSVIGIEEAGGQIWVGTFGGVFFVRDGRLARVAGPSPVFMSAFAKIRDEIWVGTDEGIDRVGVDGFVPVAFFPVELTGLSPQARFEGTARPRNPEAPMVHSIAEVGDEVWVGTDIGLFLVDERGFIPVAGAPAREIFDIVSAPGGAWLNTGEAVYKFEGGSFNSSPPVLIDGFPFMWLGSNVTVVDKDGALWTLGNGAQVFRHVPDGGGRGFTELTLPEFQFGTAIGSVQGQVWVGTVDGGVFKASGDGLVPVLDNPVLRITYGVSRTFPFAVPLLFAGSWVARRWVRMNAQRRIQRRLFFEVEQAQLLMEGLFPQEQAVVREGFSMAHRRREATTVSGDFYNFVRRGDGSLGIYFVDVEDHGLPASQQARALYQALSDNQWGLGNARHEMERADELVRRGVIFQREDVALCMNFTEIDPQKMEVRHANAGMPFPMLFRSGESQPMQLLAEGVFVGAGYSSYPVQPEAAEAAVGNGDILLLFSDGILEAKDQHGRIFGRNGIIAAVSRTRDQSPERIADEVIRAAGVHAGTEKPEDDQTLMVIRFGEGSGGVPRSRVRTLEREGTVFSLLNAGDTGAASHNELREPVKVWCLEQGFKEEKMVAQVWMATWEAIQNAFKHGSARGDVIHIQLIPPSQSGRLGVEVRQPLLWEDWVDVLGEEMQRRVRETKEVFMAGTATMIWLTDEVQVTELGRTVTMWFSPDGRPDRIIDFTDQDDVQGE